MQFDNAYFDDPDDIKMKSLEIHKREIQEPTNLTIETNNLF